MNLKSLVVMLVLPGLFCAGVTWARTNGASGNKGMTGRYCADCHTMHNSQNGNPNFNGKGVQGGLLLNTCIGCHTGDNTGSTDADTRTPMVLHLSPASPPALPYNATGTESSHDTLAGGDFGWVAGSGQDLKGHGLIGVTTTGTMSCVGTTANPNLGCHGDWSRATEAAAMSRTHHAVDELSPPSTDPRFKSGDTLPRSYRSLNGIAGYEDPDYERSVVKGTTNHNQYKGDAANVADPKTIDSFCLKCHSSASFHTSTGGAFGVSGHVSNYDMGTPPPSGPPYVYGTQGLTPLGTYNVATPLGSVDVSSPKSAVTLSSPVGDAIVVCVSCHRAHGSPYDNSLRWNYYDFPAGVNGYDACGDCHGI